MKFHELSDVLPIHGTIRYEILGTNIRGFIKTQTIDKSDISNLDVLAISFNENLVTLKPLTYKLLALEQENENEVVKIIGEIQDFTQDFTQEQLLQEIANIVKHKFNKKTLRFTINKNY